MPNDVVTLNAVSNELSSLLCGGRIEKVYQPETDEITFAVKSRRKISILVISANPTRPRIHITTCRKENSLNAPAFCMLLRKYLTGGYIENIEYFQFRQDNKNNRKIEKRTAGHNA
jgi:predicted ribosome quality control (RQC) complex YloA/Tae2 family protein